MVSCSAFFFLQVLLLKVNASCATNEADLVYDVWAVAAVGGSSEGFSESPEATWFDMQLLCLPHDCAPHAQ